MKRIKLIALFAALVAGLAIYQFLNEISKPQETPRTMVVVAAVDMKENTLITPEMVELRAVATEALLENHLLDPASAVGMVLSSDVYAGEQIVRNRLVPVGAAEDSSNTLAYVVEPGKRAVTVSVSPITGVAYLVKPGNRVDLVLNYTYEEETETGNQKETREIPASRLLLQDLKVLAVDAVLGKDGAEAFTTVSLETTPEEAVKISLAEFSGGIRLILRSSLDNAQAPESAIDHYELIGEKEGTQG